MKEKPIKVWSNLPEDKHQECQKVLKQVNNIKPFLVNGKLTLDKFIELKELLDSYNKK